MYKVLLIIYLVFLSSEEIRLPFQSENRKDISAIQLTTIGQFGIIRKARPRIPAHYHTGIDIKRPGKNYDSEPIFPIAEGKVISKRTDGPYANLIIEHTIKGRQVWSLYEHIAGIEVDVNDWVNTSKPIARYMNQKELNLYGWQFDHFHLEILKKTPLKIQPNHQHPQRFYNAYSLTCYTIDDLHQLYFDPIDFLKSGF